MNNLPATTNPLVEPPVFRPINLGVSEEQKLALLEYWRSITKRKWQILGLALATGIVAAAVAFALTPIYASTATVLIEANKQKILSIDEVYGGVGQNREHFQTQVEILKSREVAERTVRAMKLWEHPEFDPRKAQESWSSRAKAAIGMGGAKKEWTEQALVASAVAQFRASLLVEPVRLSQLVKVTFQSPDRELAAKAANALAVNYIESDRDSRFALSQQVSTFLQDRLSSLRDKLTSSEQALQKYREGKGIVSLAGSAQTLAGQQVGGTNERLMQARGRRLELESAYQQVRTGNGDYSAVPAVMRDAAVIESQRQLNDARRKLAELSQTLGPQNDKVRDVEAQVAQITATLNTLRANVVGGLTREYEAARSTEQSLEAALSTARTGVQSVNREEFELTVLDRDVQTNRQLYDMFMSRAKETNLASDVQAAVARVVDTAVVGNIPIKPAKSQITLVAMVLAAFIGAMASLLLDKLDNTVKGGDDAEMRLRMPVLTALPALDKTKHGNMALLFLKDPHSHHAEAIRTARTGVLLSNLDREHKILLITSTVPGEGKTTVAINLALAHAQTKRTLLIDADMRRSQVGKRLGLVPHHKGLTNVVSGTAAVGECVQSVEGSRLHVMTVGDHPPNPLELLLSQRFRESLRQLSELYEIVIIDSPPVELVSEALVIAPLATSTVFVVKAMSTPAPLARKSIARLQRAGANMLGVIVNQLDFSHAQRYYGEYGAGGYGYSGYEGYGGYGKPQLGEAKAGTRDDDETESRPMNRHPA